MKNKIDSYMGFAKRSRNLITGTNACMLAIERKQVRLIIIAEDISENTKKKLVNAVEKRNIPYRLFGTEESLSEITGERGRSVFGVTDKNFADIIIREIDETQSIE